MARAERESRSVSNMAEVLLEAALTERGGGGSGERRSPVVDAEVAIPEPKAAPRSVSSADTVAVPPAVHDEGMQNTYAAASRMALRDGRCGADVARGTKCKLCGKVH